MLISKVIERLEKEGVIQSVTGFPDGFEVDYISVDSRKIKPNTLFFVEGANFKQEYLEDAIKNGVTAYVATKDMGVDLPHIIVSNIRVCLPIIANLYYGNPSSKYMLAGITGTKGKTTTTYMVRNILNEYFGQDNVGLANSDYAMVGETDLHKGPGTTPEAFDTYRVLNEFAERNVKAAIMEVTSQALAYNRIDEVEFDVGAYLNLGSDHVSPFEHKDLEEYKSAKKRLLQTCKFGVVVIDDEFADEFIEAATCEELVTCSIKKDADYKAENIELTKTGSKFTVNGEPFELRIAGEVNVSNALVAMAICEHMGCDTESIRRGLLDTIISGHMEIFEEDGYTIIIDFAHDDISFEAVFKYINQFYPDSRTICLFGLAGNRAYVRRKDLPRIAGKYADYIIVTADDPCRERLGDILDEICETAKTTMKPYARIEDRELAVYHACDVAKPGDVIFLAGKGMEQTQLVGNGVEYYKGDLNCIRAGLERKRKTF